MIISVYMIAVFCCFCLITIIILIKLTARDFKIKSEKDSECNKYLDSVFYRINTASSPQALTLLLDEMHKSVDKYTYSEETYIRSVTLKGYLVGRAQGLKGSNFIFNSKIL